jgi:hypothetical protein
MKLSNPFTINHHPTVMSAQSPLLVNDVKALRDLVSEAWAQCIWDYLQLVTKRLVNRTYPRHHINQCLSDSVEFNNFSQQLNGPEFRNRQVWRAWFYIRELVMKYLPKDDGRIVRMEQGTVECTWFNFTQFIGGSGLKATSKHPRPSIEVSLADWNTLPQTSLNNLLDQAVENCGYEIGEREDWTREDVFNFNSQRLTKLLV